ncbi:MAG: helix-hairpin-helix domain-containing protein [Myxococcota bacterium]|nr:helix-hairpin-helix domain-containing protein [Myxococcota bacterium]
MFTLLLGGLSLAGTLQVDVLDVGQGDSILIQTPSGKSILIDAGTGGTDVAPLLRARGVEQLSMMIATHPHADHIGGLDEVLMEIPVRSYFDSGLTHTTASYTNLMTIVESKADAEETRYFTAEAGFQTELEDGLTLEFLGPPLPSLSGTRSDLNSNSVITRLTHGSQCFLFTGDAEEPTEALLLQRGIEPCNVLKVAHHGSAHSTTDRWLAAIQPEIALISVGEGNRYKHPAPDTVARLTAAGADIYRTDLHGTIHLESDGETVTITTERIAADVADGGLSSLPDGHSITVEVAHTPAAAPPDPSGLININKASAAQLDELPGIGPSKAAAIIDYRSKMGAFTTIEQLDNVPGIGPATMAKLRSLVTL